MRNSRYYDKLGGQGLIVVSILAIVALLLFGCAEPVQAAEAQQDPLDQLIATVLGQEPNFDEYDLPDGSTLEVHTINLIFSNAYLLVTDDGMILVDAGMPLFAPVILDYMDQIGRDDLNLIYITHAHLDHYGSSAELRRDTGAPIAIHEADAESMSMGRTQLGQVRNLRWLSKTTLPWIEPLLTVEPTEPDVILQDGDRLDDYGVPAEVVYTPGHTPGSSVLLVDNGVAIVGDLLSASSREGHVQRSYAHDWRQIVASLKKLQQYDPQVYYAGHGERPISAERANELIEEFPREER